MLPSIIGAESFQSRRKLSLLSMKAPLRVAMSKATRALDLVSIAEVCSAVEFPDRRHASRQASQCQHHFLRVCGRSFALHLKQHEMFDHKVSALKMTIYT